MTCKRDNLRSRGLRDKARKFRSYSKWEETRLRPDVIDTTVKVEQNRKRIFKDGESKGQKNKSDRKRSRKVVQDNVFEQFEVTALPTAREMKRTEIGRNDRPPRF
jgi:hypothetical protein